MPLHTWLAGRDGWPDPVSALIHAATMVTAGVYLIVRSPLYELAPATRRRRRIGAFTALFGATIGLVQTNIKRVLAYSTMSQIGYMFLAPVSGRTRGIFHLFTHAFFKALLFLAAGPSSTPSRRGGPAEDGRSAACEPRTYVAFLIGSLALVGISPLSGFLLQGLDPRFGARLGAATGSPCCSRPAASGRS